jgi:hypothetical protein
MKTKKIIFISFLALAGMILTASWTHAQVPHTILAMLRDDSDSSPESGQVKFQAYIKDVSDGGVHSETRTDDDTGNAYGDGVMGNGWLQLECANFTQFEWANGDSLRLAIVNTETGQLFVASIELDAAVEPQVENTLYFQSSVNDFHGGCSQDQISVEWFLEGVTEGPAFHVYRSTTEPGPYQRMTQEPVAPQDSCYYCYHDLGVSEGSVYYYKLGLAEFSDSLALFGPIAVTARTDVADEADGTIPSEYGLSQNYPNPFNPETTIDYQVRENVPVQMVVYNLLGQQVRSLVNEVKSQGYHSITWDGRDDGGNLVSSGVYFCYLTAGSYRQTRKMTLLK